MLRAACSPSISAVSEAPTTAGGNGSQPRVGRTSVNSANALAGARSDVALSFLEEGLKS